MPRRDIQGFCLLPFFFVTIISKILFWVFFAILCHKRYWRTFKKLFPISFFQFFVTKMPLRVRVQICRFQWDDWLRSIPSPEKDWSSLKGFMVTIIAKIKNWNKSLVINHQFSDPIFDGKIIDHFSPQNNQKFTNQLFQGK